MVNHPSTSDEFELELKNFQVDLACDHFTNFNIPHFLFLSICPMHFHKNWYFSFGFCVTFFSLKWKVENKGYEQKKLYIESLVSARKLKCPAWLRTFSAWEILAWTHYSTEQAQGCLTSVIQREFQKYFVSIAKKEGKRL